MTRFRRPKYRPSRNINKGAANRGCPTAHIWEHMQEKRTIESRQLNIILVLSILLGLLLPCVSIAQEMALNPLQTYREQMKTLNRECAGDPNNKACKEMKNRLRDDMVKLRSICKRDPDDERCGAILKEKKSRGWRLNQFCQQNPHSKKCVRMRERDKRRTKLKRKFCSKNPDEKRCFSRRHRKAKGHGTLHEYCKQYPKKPKCIALAEKMNKGKPKPRVESNAF